MKAKLLSFTFIYFSESGLFKGLQPIQIKKSFPLSHRGSNITTSHSSPGVRYWAGAQRGQQKYV
jgi:hypothetical protein